MKPLQIPHLFTLRAATVCRFGGRILNSEVLQRHYEGTLELPPLFLAS
jgi:hypothetical protein